MQFRYEFTISELLLRVESPRELQIPENFKAFRTEGPSTKNPDVILHFLFQPAAEDDSEQQWQGNDVRNFPGFVKIDLGNGEYILRQNSSGRGTPCRIYVSPGFADTFCTSGSWLNCIEMERIMLEHDRFFLHASAVIYQGEAYLFSAPSGGGKSTHAALWQQHFGARLLNGDKVLIEVRESQCIAHGSPVAGSSGIYEQASAPIAAVYLMKKEKENRIIPIPMRGALMALYSEAIKDKKDPAFNTKLLDLIEKMLMYIPVRMLACLPEKSAVECVLQKEEGMKL